MSTMTQITDPDLGLEALVYRLNVDEYERLADFGVLNDPRVELIDGLLVRKMTKKPPHVLVSERLRHWLERSIPPGWHIRPEHPIRIPDFDEPEPDLAAVRGSHEDFPDRHPEPADVGLIIEVADSSLGYDRGAKLRAYARAGIAVYWIVNLVDRRIEVYTRPNPGGYGASEVFNPGDLVVLVLDGQEHGRVAAADLLP
jgi:Uma2 family endonuclease